MKRFATLMAAALFALVLALYPGCGDDDDDDGTVANNEDAGGDGNLSTSDDDDDDDDVDDDADDDSDDGVLTVALVFQSEATATQGFALLIGDGGGQSYNVYLATMEDSSFDNADVIVVDADTTWSSVADAGIVSDTGKPVLGMGSGGLALFQVMGLNMSLDNTEGVVYDFEDTFTVVAPEHEIFTDPVDFDLIDEDPVTVLNTNVELYAVSLSPEPPSGVTVLATREGDELRGGILLEDSIYMSWGLDLRSTQLNGIGSALFINCLNYLYNKI